MPDAQVYDQGSGEMAARERQRPGTNTEGKGGRGFQKQVVVNLAPIMLSRDASPGALHLDPCTLIILHPTF